MSINKIKDLLEQLQNELRNTTEQLDSSTQQELQKMDASIHQILSAENLQHQDIHDGIMEMEYEFLTKHPVASGIMREMIDILSKAGI